MNKYKIKIRDFGHLRALIVAPHALLGQWVHRQSSQPGFGCVYPLYTQTAYKIFSAASCRTLKARFNAEAQRVSSTECKKKARETRVQLLCSTYYVLWGNLVQK